MRVAVTGGMAEGKSTLVDALARRGLRTVSADDVARDLRKDPEARQQIAAALDLGPAGLEDGLRLMVADARGRRRVNAVMHPLVWRRMQQTPHDVAEIPLLVEACLYGEYDLVVLVTCGEAEQLRRLAARLGGMEDAKRMVDAQLKSRAKKPFADLIVRTDAPLGAVDLSSDQIGAFFDKSF